MKGFRVSLVSKALWLCRHVRTCHVPRACPHPRICTLPPAACMSVPCQNPCFSRQSLNTPTSTTAPEQQPGAARLCVRAVAQPSLRVCSCVCGSKRRRGMIQGNAPEPWGLPSPAGPLVARGRIRQRLPTLPEKPGSSKLGLLHVRRGTRARIKRLALPEEGLPDGQHARVPDDYRLQRLPVLGTHLRRPAPMSEGPRGQPCCARQARSLERVRTQAEWVC